MIIPIKCFTCGNVLANKYLFYLQEVSKLKLAKDEKNDKIQYFTKTTLDKYCEGEVLDKLQLTKQCCLRHMLTHVDIF